MWEFGQKESSLVHNIYLHSEVNRILLSESAINGAFLYSCAQLCPKTCMWLHVQHSPTVSCC